MRRLTVGLTGLLLAVAWTGATQAAIYQWPVADGGNDHWYEPVAVPGGIAWTAARDAAVAKGGYLATIASEAENLFVFSLVDAPEYWLPRGTWNWGPWLGGYQDPADTPTHAANWKWVSGEPWSYTKWMGGEPNDAMQQEAYLEFYSDWNYTNLDRSPFWNDEADNSRGPTCGFVVEYENAIPEPCTLLVWSLLGASGVTIGWSRRRKRAG